MTTDELIDAIIEREGGFVDHPDDRGGPTKFGITMLTLQDDRKRPVSVEEVKQLSVADARDIYKRRYVEGPGFTKINDEGLRALVVDSAVQHGPTRATEMLQAAVGVPEGGKFGEETEKAVNAADARKLWFKLFGERLRYYGYIVKKSPSQSVFIYGWMSRMSGLLDDFAS